MKKFWKKASARAGFTLVELVVVIAVLAILAAVAYPAYTGYIKRANDAKVLSEVSNVVIAAQSALALNNRQESLTGITISSAGKITIEVSSTISDTTVMTKIYQDIGGFIGETGDESGVQIAANKWEKLVDNSTYKDSGLKWDGEKWQ